MKLWLIGVGVALVALLACSSPNGSEVPSGVTVELDAFSGRPNPTWTLTWTEAKELQRRLADLPPSESQGMLGNGLGYRGFWVSNPGGRGNIPERIGVYQGLVVVEAERESRSVFRDVNRIEEWLREQAGRRGYGGVFRSRTSGSIGNNAGV